MQLDLPEVLGQRFAIAMDHVFQNGERQTSKHIVVQKTDFSASNENNRFRRGECTFTPKNKEEKDLNQRKFSSHNVLFTKMTLNDGLLKQR